MTPEFTPQSAVSRPVFMAFRRGFGTSPRLLDFVLLYEELRLRFLQDAVSANVEHDEALESLDGVDSELVNRFRVALSLVLKEVKRNDLYSIIDVESKTMLPILRRLGNANARVGVGMWRTLAMSYAEMLRAALADKGSMTTLGFVSLPGLRWPQLRMASAKQEAVEKLKYEDPDLYQRTLMSQEQARKINRAIEARVVSDGLKVGRANVFGRVVTTGEDPVTGERVVYDMDGSRIPIDDFFDRIRTTNRELDAAARVNLKSLRELETLRKLSPEQTAQLASVPLDRIRYVSLTDDPNKDTSLTRIYPVIEIDGTQYVQSGRFKGIAVPDLVNRAGRLIEGSSYYYDPETKRVTRREIKGEGGQPDIRKQSEPYVTLTKVRGQTRLLLTVGSTHEWTEVRNAVFALSRIQPTIEYQDKTRKSVYIFEAKDFGVIRKRVGGLALSNAAAQYLKRYFDDLLRAQQAAESEDLGRFDLLGLKRPLWHFQKKSLAWLEANGDAGVCALDAGMGKTTVAIATMRSLQKRRKAGETITGNGRFLFVCEKALAGNFTKEVYEVLASDRGQYDAAEVLENTDVVTYAAFLKNRKANPTYGDDYTAVFFDEAHLHLIKRTSEKYRAAVNVKCPRKIILSASPLVATPRDMFVLASVTNGIDLSTSEGQEQERRFVDRFAKKVGNRIVGVTDDPDLEEDLRTWVKRNLYYADKRDTANETGLPPLTRTPPVAVTMDPEIEVLYRQTMSELLVALKETANKAVRGDTPVAIESVRLKLGKLIGFLTKLSDVPGEVVPGYEGNPKLDQALSILRDKVAGRTLLFTDSPQQAKTAYERIRLEFMGRTHALALNNKILVTDPMGSEKVYTQKAYTDPVTGRQSKPAEWATVTLKKIQQIDGLMSLTLTGRYAVGQNLQTFSSVIHLDRDSWSNETMKQRTARAWRSGQRQEVTEFTLDTVYANPVAGSSDDRTLDEIRRYLQEMDADLFDRVIKDSKDYVLGETWTGIEKQRAMTYHLDRRMLERALSPYASQLGRSAQT